MTSLGHQCNKPARHLGPACSGRVPAPPQSVGDAPGATRGRRERPGRRARARPAPAAAAPLIGSHLLLAPASASRAAAAAAAGSAGDLWCGRGRNGDRVPAAAAAGRPGAGPRAGRPGQRAQGARANATEW